MKIRLLGIAALLLAFAQPVAARIELTAEEREIVLWFSRDEATDVDDAVSNVTAIADQAVTRSLLLVSCPVKPGPQRFVDPKYLRLVFETTAIYERTFEEEQRSQGYMSDVWQGAAIYAWRRWSASQRQDWLDYMRSTDAQWGYVATRISVVLEGFNTHATDLGTGAVMPSERWPGWLNAVLAKSGLENSFRRAANQLEPGLGDRFLAEAAKPLSNPVTEQERKTLGELTVEVAGRWEALYKALLADWTAADPVAKGRMDKWADHPLVREIDGYMLSSGAPGADVKHAAFLTAVGLGPEHGQRRMDALIEALRPRRQAMCDGLR